MKYELRFTNYKMRARSEVRIVEAKKMSNVTLEIFSSSEYAANNMNAMRLMMARALMVINMV